MKRPVAGLLATLMLGLMAGCSNNAPKPAAPEPVVPPMSASDTADLLSSLANPEPLPELPLTTRSFLLASEQPDTAALGWSFVLLPHMAIDERERSLQQETCSSFLQVLQQGDEDARDLLMPAYWPLFRDANLEDCSQLISSHDRKRARKLLGDKVYALSMGPVLAAWTESGDTRQRLVLDMSKFDKSATERALKFWAGELARDPQYWKMGFNLPRIRSELSDLRSKYGQNILQLDTLK